MRLDGHKISEDLGQPSCRLRRRTRWRIAGPVPWFPGVVETVSTASTSLRVSITREPYAGRSERTLGENKVLASQMRKEGGYRDSPLRRSMTVKSVRALFWLPQWLAAKVKTARVNSIPD